MTDATTINFISPRQLTDAGEAILQDGCAPRLRSVVGMDGVLTQTMVCASGATLGAFDHQRTIDLMEEAVLSNMGLRAQLAELQAAHAMSCHEIELREEFTSMAAHELMTPLHTLLMQAQLRRRAPASDSGSAERNEAMVQRDERMISNMVRLIDDMRDTARMEHGKMAITPRPMDLALMVGRVARGFEARAATAGCDLSFAAPDRFAGTWDEFRLEQVLGNLLTNAIRYGPGKPICVNLESEPREAVLQVRDGGRGIAQEDLGRIFERFERAGDHSSAPGLGLGLYISSQIARQHGGRIDVESVPGTGSVFTLRLPAAVTREKRCISRHWLPDSVCAVDNRRVPRAAHRLAAMSPFRTCTDWSGFQQRVIGADEVLQAVSPVAAVALQPVPPAIYWWERLLRNRRVSGRSEHAS